MSFEDFAVSDEWATKMILHEGTVVEFDLPWLTTYKKQ